MRRWSMFLAAFLAIFAGPRAASAQTFEIVQAFPLGGEPWAPLIEGEPGVFYGTTLYGGREDRGTVFRIDANGNFVTLHDFEALGGYAPRAGLIRASDGYFYGATTGGGTGNAGTLFRIDANGVFVKLHDFDYFVDGGSPEGELLEASDGYLYGTTASGGSPSTGSGVVFRYDRASGVLSLIHVFAETDGANPRAALVQASDGRLFGTTTSGGTTNSGTAYRIDTDGTFHSIHNFYEGRIGEPGNPNGALAAGPNGFFYGTASSGGAGHGGIYRMDADGNVLPIHNFGGLEGNQPDCTLVFAADGFFYGTTQTTVYRMDLAGGLVVIHTLTPDEGTSATPGVIQGSDGYLYGTAKSGGDGFRGTVFQVDRAGPLTVLHSFASPGGQFPLGGVIEGPDGFLYGTTESGGLHDRGTIFRMNKLGSFATLHNFAAPGGLSVESLFRTPNGDLYGATGESVADGTVFRLSGLHTFATLHTFGQNTSVSGVVQAADGNLYGTTPDGGDGNVGQVYRVDGTGNVTTFFSFTIASAGPLIPLAALVTGSDGALYGTTSAGGSEGSGSVFRLDLQGSLTELHGFGDSEYPSSPVFRTADGTIYGTTQYGGALGKGTVFRIDTDGTFSTLHEFLGTDGQYPRGGVVLASDGALYGTTAEGLSSSGRVFRIDSSGVYSTVAELGFWTSMSPRGELIEASDGNIYGTAGMVFRIVLSPFAVTRLTPLSAPASGGRQLSIGGAGFVSGASVTIGGVACPDAVVSGATDIVVSAPALPPGSINDIVVVNPDNSSATLPRAYLAEFLDVEPSSPFRDGVERMARYGITAGCGGGSFCPDQPATRAQAAVFLLRAKHGEQYVPPQCHGVFTDTTCPGPFTDWVEAFAAEGITAGCGGGRFCPDDPVTRAQFSALILRTTHGAAYVPPGCAGVFGDVVCPSLYADWIEQLAAEGISAGCLDSPALFCPDRAVTRGQAAALLANAFQLP